MRTGEYPAEVVASISDTTPRDRACAVRVAPSPSVADCGRSELVQLPKPRMCGLAGIMSVRGETAETLRSHVGAMAERLHHRGPDDSGIWTDAASGIALGFRRLAIVDLSPAGHQPMSSAGGRFTMVF